MPMRTHCHGCQGWRRAPGLPHVCRQPELIAQGKRIGKGATKRSGNGGNSKGKGQKGGKGQTRVCCKCNRPGHIEANCRSWSANGMDRDTGEGLQGVFRDPLVSRRRRPWESSGFCLDAKFLGTKGDANDSKCIQAGRAAARAAVSPEVKLVTPTVTRGASEGSFAAPKETGGRSDGSWGGSGAVPGGRRASGGPRQARRRPRASIGKEWNNGGGLAAAVAEQPEERGAALGNRARGPAQGWQWRVWKCC